MSKLPENHPSEPELPHPDLSPPEVLIAEQASPIAPSAVPAMSLQQWLETLRRTDRAFYNIMAMEVWSMAKTMDGLFPGFWHRFMHNRQTAMKQYIELKKQNSATATPNSAPPPPNSCDWPDRPDLGHQ